MFKFFSTIVRALVLAVIGFLLLVYFDVIDPARFGFSFGSDASTNDQTQVATEEGGEVRRYGPTGAQDTGGNNTDEGGGIGDWFSSAVSRVTGRAESEATTIGERAARGAATGFTDTIRQSAAGVEELLTGEPDAQAAESQQRQFAASAYRVPDSPETFAREIRLEVNAYRDQQGIGVLSEEEELASLASDIARRTHLGALPAQSGSAVRSDSSGRLLCVENIAIDFSTPAGALQYWQNSAQFNENLLKSDMARFGVGEYEGVVVMVACK